MSGDVWGRNVQDYKSLCAAIVISAILVTHTDTDSFLPARTISSQIAEQNMGPGHPLSTTPHTYPRQKLRTPMRSSGCVDVTRQTTLEAFQRALKSNMVIQHTVSTSC